MLQLRVTASSASRRRVVDNHVGIGTSIRRQGKQKIDKVLKQTNDAGQAGSGGDLAIKIRLSVVNDGGYE